MRAFLQQVHPGAQALELHLHILCFQSQGVASRKHRQDSSGLHGGQCRQNSGSKNPLQAIALNAVAKPLRNTNGESSGLHLAPLFENNKLQILVILATALLKQEGEGPAICENGLLVSGLDPASLVLLAVRGVRDGQAITALAPTIREDFAATGRGHARTKTVRAKARDCAGLKSALHGRAPSSSEDTTRNRLTGFYALYPGQQLKPDCDNNSQTMFFLQTGAGLRVF